MLIQTLLDIVLLNAGLWVGRLRERRGAWFFKKTWFFECPDCTVKIRATDEKLLKDLVKVHELGHLAERP